MSVEMTIIISIVSFLAVAILGAVGFMVGKRYDRVDKILDDHDDKIDKISAADIEHKMLQKKNKEADIRLKNETSDLTRKMAKLAETLNAIGYTVGIHDVEIRNLKDGQEVIAKQLRKTGS